MSYTIEIFRLLSLLALRPSLDRYVIYSRIFQQDTPLQAATFSVRMAWNYFENFFIVHFS